MLTAVPKPLDPDGLCHMVGLMAHSIPCPCTDELSALERHLYGSAVAACLVAVLKRWFGVVVLVIAFVCLLRWLSGVVVLVERFADPVLLVDTWDTDAVLVV